MQWLIDIVVDYFRQHGLVTNRGDAAASDWLFADLTIDNNWHNLNMTSVIPAGVHIVYCHVRIKSNLINRPFEIKTGGFVNNFNRSRMRTLIAGVPNDGDWDVFPNSNGIVQYKGNPFLTDVQIVVKGWGY